MAKKQSTLREWRDKHFAEMDENIRTWKEIRDNPTCSAKDRSEAAKNIARSLGGLTPERASKIPAKDSQAQAALTPEEESLLASILDEHQKPAN